MYYFRNIYSGRIASMVVLDALCFGVAASAAWFYLHPQIPGFLFAGFAGFLPYLGPIIGAIPMILVAGGQSIDLALWVLALYCCIQFLESYILTPLIQSRAVSLPPAVVILNQLVFGAVFGLIGLALATPLAAASTVPLRHMFGLDESADNDDDERSA